MLALFFYTLLLYNCVADCHTVKSSLPDPAPSKCSQVPDQNNPQDEEGMTELQRAAIHGKDVTSIIKSKGINVNFQNCEDYGRTALHYAVKYGNMDVLNTLLAEASDIDVNIQDEDGETVLHYAVILNNHVALERLLQVPTIDVNIKSKYDMGGLHYAVWDNDSKGLALLVRSKKLDANAQVLGNVTALHRLAQDGSEDDFLVLLKVPGIDVNLKDNRGFTALHYLMNNERNKDKALEALLKVAGVEINAQNMYLWTPLHLTGYNFLNIKRNILRLLAEPGINVNLKEKFSGKSVLHKYAEKEGNKTSCKPAKELTEIRTGILKVASLDINLQDDVLGNTALHFVASGTCDDTTFIEQLLKFPGVDVNIKNKKGETPLMLAAQHGLVNKVKKLLAAPNLDFNLKDNYGMSALNHVEHNYRSYEHMEIMDLLRDLPGIDDSEDLGKFDEEEGVRKELHWLTEFVPQLLGF